HVDAAPMLPHDALDRVQAETSALPDALGREEGLKDVGLDFGGDSWAAVTNLHHDATVVTIGPNSKLALAAHGVNRVVDDVGPNLVQLAAEGIHQKRQGLIITFHSHTLFELVVQDGERGFEALYDIDILYGSLVHVSVFLDRPNQVRDPRSAALDFVQQGRDL